MYIIISELKRIYEMNISFKKILSVCIVLVLTVLLPACSVKETKKPDTPKPVETQSPEDNSITIGVVELDTYNPLTTKSSTTKNMLGFIFEPLFALDSKHNTAGVLAKSYESAPDGKSIKINLKENVLWHNGKLFTAKDVVYTINMIINNDTVYTKTLKNVRAVTENDQYSLSVYFDRSVPNPTMLLSFPVIENGSFGKQSKPIGTGPFFHDYDRLKAFEAYHGNKPQIEYIKVRSVPDYEKFNSLFNASAIDVADSSLINMTEYTPRSNATVTDFVSDEMVFVGFNCSDAVFSNREARKGVYELIDRKNIVSHIYFSRATESFYPMNPDLRFYPSVSGNVRGDQGKAEDTLKSGGWKKDKNGLYFLPSDNETIYFGIEILVSSENEERVAVAESISKSMSEMGMKNTVSKCSESEFYLRVTNGNYDMFIGKTSLLPNNDFNELVTGPNMFNYSDEKTKTLLAQLGTLTLEKDKAEVYNEFFEHFESECPIAPVCFLKESIITSAKIKSGVSPSVIGVVTRPENWSIK